MRLSILAAGALATSFVVLAPESARAADAAAPAFGSAGTINVSWDQPLVAGSVAAVSPGLASPSQPLPMALTPIGFQYYTGSNNAGSGTIFSLAPAADYFVIDNLSVGAQLMLGFLSSSPPAPAQGSTTTLYGIAPQVGYNLSLTDSISFWPKLFFAFAGNSTSNNGGSTSSGTLGIFAPFLFHLATHFYAGVGPDLSTQLFVNQSNGAGQSNPNTIKVTTFGAMATVGGWFNL